MFYKVENGQLIKAPEKSLKVFIANPTEEQYKFFGYTNEIVEDELPEEQENKIIVESYEQIDGIIYKHYHYKELFIEEEIIDEYTEASV